jgi:membrane protein implicated in regulation of membrane protease activity
MNTAKVLSIMTFIGIVVLALIAFGCTWKVLGIGIVVSAILSIIYYIVVKNVVEALDSPADKKN